ncbi:MAG: hypothetical protein ACFFD8_07805 [Candidatus Thorarchaeota archaeon]
MASTSESSSGSLRLASYLSIVLSPPFIAFATIIVFAFYSPIGTGLLTPLQSSLLGIIFIVVGPILPLTMLVILGRLTFDVTNRRDRPLLYLAAILVYLVGSMVAWLYQNHLMAVIGMAYAAVTAVIAVISIFWKISAHTAGVAGPLTGLIWVYGSPLIPFMFLAGLVAWARWRQELHTINQLAGGIIIAIIVTSITYWLLWGYPRIL